MQVDSLDQSALKYSNIFRANHKTVELCSNIRYTLQAITNYLLVFHLVVYQKRQEL